MADAVASALEQLEPVLARARETEPSVHAYVHLDEDAARAAAAAVDERRPRGPLHGAPFAVKEVFAVAGLPAAGGSRALAERVAHEDAAAVRRLRDAGAVLVGTQVSHELTCGLDTPPTRNPWALDRYPGGSSAGAGASVAVGSARVALGTDAAGSVRIPAAMTGVAGLKPTAGRIPAGGVVREASAPSIDHVGIAAACVADVAAALDALADPAPGAGGRAAGSERREDAPAPLAGVRLGVLGEATRDALLVHALPEEDVVTAVAAACEELERLGAELVEVEAPALARAPEAVGTFFAAELAEAHRELLAERPGDYHPGVRALLEQGLAIPPAQIAAAVRTRDELREALRSAFDAAGVAALVTPTVPRAAMPLATFDPATELGTLIPFTCPFNLTGLPALSVPCGFTAEGLPIGLQLAGRPFADERLLGIAAAYERVTSWHGRRPQAASVTVTSGLTSVDNNI